MRSWLFCGLFIFFLNQTILWAEAPSIRLKVAEYSNRIEFTCPQGGEWSLGSARGTIKPSDSCKISGDLLAPASIKYHVMVESIPMRESEKLALALEKWKATGRPIHTFQLGKKTEGYDGRIVFIGVGAFMNLEPAQKLVDELAAESQSSWIMEETLKLSRGKLEFTINGKKVAAGEVDLTIFPKGLIHLKKVEYAKGFSWHGYADRNFRGRMTIQWGAQNALNCVLTTDLETILAGVVPSEISSKAAPAALQAQAVAARGEILSKMGMRHLNEGFDFCSEQHCQVYSGETKESVATAKSIAPTRGYVLMDLEGGILDAVYAANCGGHSEASHVVWTAPENHILMGKWDYIKPLPFDLTTETGARNFILSRPQVFCNDPTVEGGDKFRWEKKLSATDWKEVEKRGGVGRIREIKDFSRGISGRLFRLTLVGEKGSRSIMKELAIRKLFGTLRSACFIVNFERDKSGYINGAKFRGAGWGHGVGMCQTGAQSMAKRGFSFQKILAHYFPGSHLAKVY